MLCVDCFYVGKSLQALLANGALDVSYWDNADMWRVVKKTIDDHDGDISVRKVKGHATLQDCQGVPELIRDKAATTTQTNSQSTASNFTH